jgi:putative ATP-grasp target RiPP
MTSTTVRPWGLSRAVTITPDAETAPTCVEVDPKTQTGRGDGNDGKMVYPFEASPKHGSGTTTRPRTATGQDGGGRPAPDSDTGYDGDRD